MLESPKLEKKKLFKMSLPKRVRVDQNEYELTKMSTSWPDNEYELINWVRIDQNENELIWVRIDLSTSWLGAGSYEDQDKQWRQQLHR